MQAEFKIESSATPQVLTLDIHTFIVAGWAGRDMAAIEHHIEELAAIGVPRPSSVPLYYRIGHNQMTQADVVEVVGPHSSGEIETFVFAAGGRLYISIASDHTDRKLESHSVALSKQICPKPTGSTAWRYEEVEAHWDQLIVRSWIEEGGKRVLYQSGPLSTLRTPRELVEGYLAGAGLAALPDGTGMTCGTVPAIGGIRPASGLEMELHDPVLGRSLFHRYTLNILPEVA